MLAVVSRRLRGVVPIVVLLLTLSCQSQRDTPWEGQETHDLQGVILILLDTLRPDHLGCYGFDERPTSPNLDALAGEGVLFSQTVATSPWTLPSMASMMAGQYSERVFRKGLTVSLVESLQAAGIETVAFTEGGFVSQELGFDLGFDEWTEEEGEIQFLEPGEELDPDKQGDIERTFAATERWLSGRHDGRFFLFVHTYEPHTPYTNHDFTEGLSSGRIGSVFTLGHVLHVTQRKVVMTEDEVEYMTAMYDGDIASTDRHVGRLLAKLGKLGLADRVAVIVTSDHGEELGEHYPHNTGDHGHSLMDNLMLVPLIIRDPSASYPSQIVDRQVRTIDILPTVADLMDVPVETKLDGRSLLPLMRGEDDDSRLALLGQTKVGPLRIGLRGMGFKYITSLPSTTERRPLVPEPAPRQLYDLGADPGELTNIPQGYSDLRLTLDQLLENHPGRSRFINPDAAVDMDPELVERLKSLGYLQ